MAEPCEGRVLIFAGGGISHVAGGVGTLLRYLMAEWAKDPGCLDVQVIDTRGTGGVAAGMLRFGFGAARLLWGGLSGRATCAHINMTTRGSAWRKAILLVLARLCGVPAVLHLHGADFFEFHAGLPRLAKRMFRAALAGAACVIVIGQQARRRLMDELDLPASRVRVVMNGVPAVAGIEQIRRARPARDPVRILFLGRICARKGVPELVESLASPPLRARAWRAKIAGDGDGVMLAGALAQAGLVGRVDTPGWLDPASAARALAGADILVLPSHHEVLPMAVLEAMAHGLAIIATPVGSIPEILRHGVNALLVPSGDPSALATCLARLIDNPRERMCLGEQARRDFTARLDVRIAAAELQGIYRAAARRPAARAAARIASA